MAAFAQAKMQSYSFSPPLLLPPLSSPALPAISASIRAALQLMAGVALA